MKKFFASMALFAVLTTLAFTSSAQLTLSTLRQTTATSGAAADTITDAETDYLYTQLLASNSTTLEIFVNVLKGTGTQDVTLTLESSLNGTNWARYTYDDVAQDTLSAGDVSGTSVFHFTLANPGARFYRVKATGAGTMVSYVSGQYYGRRQY